MGRKRKLNVARYPGGQVKYDKPRPHRQWLRDYGRIMRLPLNTQIAMLHLENRITDQECEAGFDYREAREAYREAMGFAPPYARAQDLLAIRGLAIQPDDDVQRSRREKAERRLTFMEDIIGLGTVELRAVQWVCGEDRAHESHEQFLALKAGLAKLAASRKGGRA